MPRARDLCARAVQLSHSMMRPVSATTSAQAPTMNYVTGESRISEFEKFTRSRARSGLTDAKMILVSLFKEVEKEAELKLFWEKKQWGKNLLEIN